MTENWSVLNCLPKKTTIEVSTPTAIKKKKNIVFTFVRETVSENQFILIRETLETLNRFFTINMIKNIYIHTPVISRSNIFTFSNI